MGRAMGRAMGVRSAMGVMGAIDEDAAWLLTAAPVPAADRADLHHLVVTLRRLAAASPTNAPACAELLTKLRRLVDPERCWPAPGV